MITGIDYIGITTPFYCNDGKGNFILHKRGKMCRDEQGTWDFGGGKLEFGETLETSVLREVEEEYGVTGSIQEQLPAISLFREHNNKKTHWIVIPFFILVDVTKAKNMEPGKMEEIGIFTLLTLPQPLHSGLQKSLIQYKSYFDKYTFA